jgi:hypothetical protein
MNVSNQYHSQIVIIPVGCVVLEMWQLISEKLLAVKCLVFSEDGCENNAKFYLELCIKYCIPYAGSMRGLMFHMSCGHCWVLPVLICRQIQSTASKS